MIEESLLKSGFAGRDGFVWWIGQVAQQNSWKPYSKFSKEQGSNGEVWASRCKVRIVGYHTFDGGILPDDDLPWAQIMMDPTFGSIQGGVGATNNLKGGETCFGFFLDGDDAQQPVVVGLLYRSSGVKNLISEESIAKEKSSRFKPFTGHPGNVIQSTQRNAREEKIQDPDNPNSETPPSSPTDQIGDKFCFRPASLFSVEKKADIKITIPNGCQNGLIGDISKIVQSFVAVTNGLDRYLHVYIDPVLNEVRNIGNEIYKAARSILGIVKLIINNLRSTIFKCLTWAFRKLVGLIVPPPQQTIVLEAMKKIFDIIFCILEKLPGSLFDFIKDLLRSLVDTTVNVPICAVEQLTAGILAKLMNLIDEAMAPILSGINWLTGGLGTISDILNQASSLASQIFSFLECTGLACKKPYEWASKFGPTEKESDDWKKMVENVDVFRTASTYGASIEQAIAQIPLYSTTNVFGKKFGGLIDNALANPTCAAKVTNPQTQDDLMYLTVGNKWKYCIPPVVKITGLGVGAEAVPIVADNSEIFSIEVINPGIGYDEGTTNVTIVDNSGYGSGATAKVIVAEDSSISAIYLTSVGSGYCKGNVTAGIGTTSGPGIGTTGGPDIRTTSGPGIGTTGGPGIGTTGGPGIGTTGGPGIGTTGGSGIRTTGAPGITSFISGCVDRIIVRSPGYGYTSGDTITDGRNTYNIIVSPGAGYIIDIIQPNNPICQFTSTPTLTINTNTGVGGAVLPLMKYTPSYTRTVPIVISGIGFTSIIDCIGK